MKSVCSRSVLSIITPLVLSPIFLLAPGPQARAGANSWVGGSTWDTSSPNWFSPSTWVNGDDAFFEASGAGTVTVAAGVQAHNVAVSGAPYMFTGGTLTLTGSLPTFYSNAPVRLASNLLGVDGATFEGTSSITLEGRNTYTGLTYVRSGTVVLKGNIPLATNGSGINDIANFAIKGIDSLDEESTVQLWAGTPFEDVPGHLVLNRTANGQIYRFSTLTMTGGTLDLNGDDNNNQWPAPTGVGIITNTSPYARGAFQMCAPDGSVRVFSGVIQNGNGGDMTVSTVPNTNAGVTPVVFKQGYRMDIDLKEMVGSARFVMDAVNTYSGFTRIGSGVLSFTSRGKWGRIVNTGNPVTSTPSGSIICNGSINDLRVDFNGTSQVTGGLSGNGGIFANNMAGTCSTLTLGAGDITNTAWPTGGGGQNGKITDKTSPTGGMMALTKTGTGTIGLPTAQNNYSGPTIINAGILEFTANGAPSANSDHQINSPGVLKLSYTGSKNVNSLWINGVRQPAGTYSAGNQAGFITGGGSITVVQVHEPVITAATVARVTGGVEVSWTGCGVLQSSADLATWTDLPGIASPYFAPDTATRKFFRVKY